MDLSRRLLYRKSERYYSTRTDIGRADIAVPGGVNADSARRRGGAWLARRRCSAAVYGCSAAIYGCSAA
eukprot:3400411-Rhodomonas_salina.1